MKRWVVAFASFVSVMLMAAALSAQQTTPRVNATPSMASPPMSGTPGRAANPTTLGDCANGGWKMFPSHRFGSQRACERFVNKHSRPTGSGSSARTPGAAAATPAPKTTPKPPQR